MREDQATMSDGGEEEGELGARTGSDQPDCDPLSTATELAVKLASRARHVCLLTGAGTGLTAGLPDVRGLERLVLDTLHGDDGALARSLLDGRTLEEALSRLRRIQALVEGDETVGAFDSATSRRIDAAICSCIINAMSPGDPARQGAFEALARWAAGGYYNRPIEVFTVNYDTLLEEAFERLGVPYFDGYVGSISARFHPDLVDIIDSDGRESLPATFVRLWKLHGSVNWAFLDEAGGRTVVRRGLPYGAGPSTAAIYPSEEKYDASRRVPFVVLMDRFRRALLEPETLVIVTGYSFGDAHLNEIIFDSALKRPRSETVALCYSSAPPLLIDVATKQPNITVLAADEAIIGAQRMPWRAPDVDLPGVWGDGRFLLGDFEHLGRFLAGTRGIDGGVGAVGVG